MRNAKLWSVLLAFVLLCGCALGVLFTTASAAGTYELNVGGAGEFATVEAALNSVAEADLSAYESITVKVNGNVTETTTGTLLFGQKTIWKDTGVMMPIIITGEGSLTFPQGTSKSYRKFAGANDITFKDMDLPISSLYTMFFAGNGKLTFDGCDFGTGTNFRLFADNYSEATYEGWEEADYNALKDEDGHIKSILTIKNGSVTTISGDSEKRIIAATGSNVDYEATVGSVKISANNTKAELYLENVDTAHPNARYGSNPVAETILTVKDCDVKGYRAAGHESNSKVFSGDITVNVIGGTYYGFGRLLSGCTITADSSADKAPGAGNGDVTVVIDGAKPVSSFKTSSSNFIQSTWSTVSIGGDLNVTWKDVEFSRAFTAHNSATVTVHGDYNLYIDGIETGTIKGMFAEIKGNVTQTVKNLNTVSTGYTNIRLLETTKVGGNIVNDFSNWSLNYTNTTNEFYYTYLGCALGDATVNGNITSTLKNITTSAKTLWVCGNYKGTLNGDIATTVEADCSFGSGFIAGNLYGNVNGNITTTVKGGSFAPFGDSGNTYAAYTGGIYTDGNVTGKITNYIKGGTFAKCDAGYSAFMGSHQTSSYSSTGGIECVIDGGVFEGYVFAGTRGSTNISNSVQGEPAIKATINGGTFHGFWALRGKVTGDVVTEINGGTFETYSARYPYVFSGGLFRDTGSHVSGDAITTINGGTFKDSVVAGVVNHNDVAEKVQPGKAMMTIHGGTFMKNIFAGSYNPVGNLSYAENELIIDLTKTDADDLAIFGAVGLSAEIEADVYSGGMPEVKVIAPVDGAEMTIGKDTDIYATSAVGKINYHQTEGWLGHDYIFTENSDETFGITVTEENGVFGVYEVGTNYLSGGYQISGATLIFDERVGVRVLLDPEMVAVYQDNFSYSVAKIGEEPFMQGTELEKWTDPADGTVYDSFMISGIGLSDFNQTFEIKIHGAFKTEFSIYDLGAMAQECWTGDWKVFAEAICNLTEVYSDPQVDHDEETFALLEVEQTRTATRDENAVTAASLGLLMSDAVGIELNVTLAEGYTSALSVKVNGNLIENALTLDGQNASVTLLFGASYMTDAFALEIVDESGASIFTLTTSIEKLASELAENAQNPLQENAQALLYYIQKVAKVA